MKTIKPLEYVQVTLEGLADWITGREILDVKVTLGQNDKGSSTEITLADPDNLIAEKLVKHSLTSGGILPLEQPISMETAGTTSVALGDSKNPTNASSWEQAIVQGCVANGVTDPNQIAYILATAQVETTMGANMIEPDSQARANNYQGRADLGNTEPGDGVRFKG